MDLILRSLLVMAPAAVLSIGSSAETEKQPLEQAPTLQLLPPNSRPRPHAPEMAQPDHTRVTRLQTAAEAAIIAYRHIITLPPDLRPKVKYVWNEGGTRHGRQVLSLALNMVSRSGTPRQVQAVDEGNTVLWFNVEDYCQTDQDLVDFLNTWANLQFDPAFSRLVTSDEVKFSLQSDQPLPDVPVEVSKTVASVVKGGTRREMQVMDLKPGRFRYPDNSGRSVKIREAKQYRVDLEFFTPDTIKVERRQDAIDLLDFDDFQAVRFNPRLPGAQEYAALQELNLDSAAIVSLDYLLNRTIRTIQRKDGQADANLFTVLRGGLYYQFIGSRLAKDVKVNGKTAAELGKTDLDVFLLDQGVLALDTKEGFNDFLDRVRSDRRGILWRSGVTDKIREWELIDAQIGHAGDNAVISITNDVDDEDSDLGTNAHFNVVKFDFKAREVIYPRPNGFHGFVLFNGAGARQDRVPPGVAIDGTIPGANGTKELQPGRGCINCHGADGASEGYKPIGNDLKGELGYYRHRYKVDGKRVGILGPRLDVAEDLNLRNKSLFDQFDRINRLYTGEPTKFLTRGRADYSEAFLRGAEWNEADKKVDNDGKHAVPYVQMGSERIIERDNAYWYDGVDARKALAEIGVGCPKQRAAAVFQALVLPEYPDLFTQGTTLYVKRIRGQLQPEVVTLAALCEGQTVNRHQWDLFRTLAAERSVQRRERLFQEEGVK